MLHSGRQSINVSNVLSVIMGAHTGQVPTATVPPPVTYVQTEPDTTYYYQPYYYPAYAW